jgi:Tfp pilus tip-associated adhesin PilY1
MGYGRGGRGHLALDVTRALEGPTVMWEIDNERYCRDGNCSPFSLHDAFDYQLLGLTTAKPAYGTLFVDGEERAVVMLPGGVSPETAGDPNVAKVVYLTDLEVGHKIAEFSVPMQNIYSYGSKVTKTEKLFDFSGSAVMYPNTPGTVSTRAFLGDGGGRIWRLDMGNPNPNKWRLELFFDPYSEISALAAESDRPMPILGAPSITINDLGQLTLIYGLGHPDYVVESSKSRVATLSVSEVTSAQGEVSANLNWHRILDPYERLSAPPNVYDKVAYFTTYVTDAINACADGEGRLYGIHFTEHTGGDNDDTSVGALDEDGDATTHDPVKYIELGDAVVRAVRIVQRPACAPGAAGGSGGGGSGSSGATRGDVELVLSVAQGGDYATSTSSSNTMTAAKGKAPVLKRTMTHSGETFQSGAWGYVLY